MNKELNEHIALRIEQEEWNKNYHTERLQTARGMLRIISKAGGTIQPDSMDDQRERAMADCKYHMERVEKAELELGILYIAGDAIADGYPTNPKP